MNIDYLMQYLSRRLHTIVRMYTLSGELLKLICGRIDLEDHLEDERKTQKEYLLSTAAADSPIVSTDSHSVAYASAIAENSIFLIGPVILDGGAECRHRLPDSDYDSLWLSGLYHCDTASLIREILLIHNLFRTDTLTSDDAASLNCLNRKIKFEIQKHFTDIVFQNQEYSSRHNPYDQEIREVSSIRTGNLEALQKSWAEDYVGDLGILAKTPLRSAQNIGIVLVTLASRAAMEGGVMPETAYSLSDSYINKIEEVKNPEAAFQLGRQAEYQYTVLVKEAKELHFAREKEHTPDSRVSRCKDYIFAHLHGKVSTAEIAKELYINPNYLSELFKKEEGITISEYILREKIKLVKNMLIYSRYSYIEIASYLGFSSQSHLGAKFKKMTGMTLHQYREKYGVKEFDPEG